MTDSKTIINPNLGVLAQEMQELIIDGWRVKEGYPILIGWTYHVDMEKPTQPEAPKQVGRPPKAATK